MEEEAAGESEGLRLRGMRGSGALVVPQGRSGVRGLEKESEAGLDLLRGEGAAAAAEGMSSPGPAADSACGGAAPNPDSWVRKMLHQVLKAPSLRVSLPDAPPVTVLLLQKYVASAASPCAAAQLPVGAPCPTYPAPCPSYYYDVTVTDGICQGKWLLDPQLNNLVQKNALCCGLGVKITQCAYVHNEKKLCEGFLCIEQLEILGLSDLMEAPQELKDNHVKSTTPLRGGKKHYLPLWNNDDPCGDIWVEKKSLQEVCVDESKLMSLSQLAMIWESKIKFKPLLVRIMHKSRLRYYGKPMTKLDIPYQAYFDVADWSGMVLMVLWNTLCPEWYNSLKVGTVLLLEQYAVKKSLSKTSPGDLQMKRFSSIEIALNVRDPPAKIYIIPEHKIKSEWKLPEVEYRFITRSELDNLPQNHFCDIIGLVQFVGRTERIKKKGCVDDFWTYRWVHVIDGTSEQPFILELFATSQPDIFEQIHPMTYLVCTQMRVEQNISENGSHTVYLTTSMKSQMFITGWHKGQPYTKDPKVKNFIQWMKTSEEASLMEKFIIGGYYLFPALPDTFSEYCKNMSEESVLTATSEMEKEIESLHYREHKRIAFQGIISAIRYVSCSSTSQDASGMQSMQISRTSAERISVSESNRINKSRIKYQQARESTSKQTSPLLQQQNIVIRSCAKRQIATIETADQPCVPPKCSYSTRAAIKKKMLLKILQDNSHARKESKEVTEAAQTFGTGNRETVDGSEKDHRESKCHNSWESVLWTAVKDNLAQHLYYSSVLPESFPCKFSYIHKEFLMKQNNLQAAKFNPKQCVTGETNHFENACPLEYYEVAILGINHDIAVEVALLCDSYLFQVKDTSRNAVFSHRSDTLSCQEAINQNGHSELLSLSDEDVKAAALEQQRVICILDICSLGKDKTEVFLRKIYKIAEVDVADQT